MKIAQNMVSKDFVDAFSLKLKMNNKYEHIINIILIHWNHDFFNIYFMRILFWLWDIWKEIQINKNLSLIHIMNIFWNPFYSSISDNN